MAEPQPAAASSGKHGTQKGRPQINMRKSLAASMRLSSSGRSSRESSSGRKSTVSRRGSVLSVPRDLRLRLRAAGRKVQLNNAFQDEKTRARLNESRMDIQKHRQKQDERTSLWSTGWSAQTPLPRGQGLPKPRFDRDRDDAPSPGAHSLSSHSFGACSESSQRHSSGRWGSRQASQRLSHGERRSREGEASEWYDRRRRFSRALEAATVAARRRSTGWWAKADELPDGGVLESRWADEAPARLSVGSTATAETWDGAHSVDTAPTPQHRLTCFTQPSDAAADAAEGSLSSLNKYMGAAGAAAGATIGSDASNAPTDGQGGASILKGMQRRLVGWAWGRQTVPARGSSELSVSL